MVIKLFSEPLTALVFTSEFGLCNWNHHHCRKGWIDVRILVRHSEHTLP